MFFAWRFLYMFVCHNKITEMALTEIEKKDIEEMISKNGEWAESGDGSMDSKRPIFDLFYKKKPDLIKKSDEAKAKQQSAEIKVKGLETKLEKAEQSVKEAEAKAK